MIEVKNFSKYYDQFLAVDNISFKVKKGEVLALLGPNGAGKSTTIKGICGYLSPSAGEIRVKGMSVADSVDEVKALIGYLPESAPLYGDMLVYDFLTYVAQVKRVSDAHKKVLEVCDLCGIRHKMSSSIGELSKGLRQRVGIAQALLGNPEILILDEPTSGLDPNQIVEVREVIKSIGRERTVILSTHILSEVEATCDRAIIIDKGKLILDSSVKDISSMQGGETLWEIQMIDASKEDIQNTFLKLNLPRQMEIAQTGDIFSVKLYVPSEKDLSREIYQMIKSKPWVLIEMHQKQKSLEEIFRELTH